jgi:hypothetical protein
MEELKENIRGKYANIPAEQHQTVNQNLFCRCEECLRAGGGGGQHFQRLLLCVNFNYFIRNVIGQPAYWFIGKILTRLAAGGAPVNKGENLHM